MLRAQGSTSPEVLWEDQQRINQFGRLNNQLHELRAELKAKQARRHRGVCARAGAGRSAGRARELACCCAGPPARATCVAAPPQSLLADLEDAGNELLIADDTEARARVVGDAPPPCAARPLLTPALLHALQPPSLASRLRAPQVRYGVGETYVTLSTDEATERLDAGARPRSVRPLPRRGPTLPTPARGRSDGDVQGGCEQADELYRERAAADGGA